MNKNDVENQIKEIKRQLNLGNASLMIGSGFSKNADRDSQNTPYPPSWNELKQVFVDRLYGTYPDLYRKNMFETKNVLQLAQEYEAEYKRAGLNALLMQLIPDSALVPNEIFDNLLKLPWQDIFTTNYDTLLERAADNVSLRKYDVVLDGRDLPFSEKPRIVKLHGSFQTEATHLIVTEEDYRTYPIKYAPFVNTVIQSIMETSFCLVGFSGTDPNFLAWLGWVRDHLNQSMPPVYLIGVLELSDSESQVLREKNIIPVDLSIGSETKDHKTLLSNFINKLMDKTPKSSWPSAENTLKWSFEFSRGDDEKKKNIADLLIGKWEKERENYPNWVILPHKKRAVLYDDVKIWFGAVCFCQNLNYPSNIQFLYEYNWRLEHCLCPICNDWIPAYEKVLKSCNPYEIVDSFFDDHIVLDHKDIEEKIIKQKWVELVFAVLRWCREEHDSERWTQYAGLLEKILPGDSNLANRYYYEKALWLLSKPDIEKLEKHLTDWKNHLDSSSEWNIKYASIIAEFNAIEEAGSIYNKMLPIIRKTIPKGGIKNDYYALGLEGIAIASLLLYSHNQKLISSPQTPSGHDKTKNNHINDSKNIKTSNTILPVLNDDSSKNSSTKDFCDEIQERLKELSQYDCNPFDELDYFKVAL